MMSELFHLVVGYGFTYGFMAFFILYFIGYAVRIIAGIMLTS